MVTANDFIPAPHTHSIDQGVFQWSAPSNIALVKYWGKKEHQIPANPSISFTLNHCKTITKLAFEKKQNTTTFSFDLLFDGKPKEEFKPKIEKFLERIAIYCPYLKNYWGDCHCQCFLRQSLRKRQRPEDLANHHRHRRRQL